MQVIQSRRDFLGSLTAAATAGVLGARTSLAEPSPEITTLRLQRGFTICQQVTGEPICLELFSHCAERYDVSLTAAILKWLEFTPEPAVLVCSRDGLIDWSVPSRPALRRGAFFKTRDQQSLGQVACHLASQAAPGGFVLVWAVLSPPTLPSRRRVSVLSHSTVQAVANGRDLSRPGEQSMHRVGPGRPVGAERRPPWRHETTPRKRMLMPRPAPFSDLPET